MIPHGVEATGQPGDVTVNIYGTIQSDRKDPVEVVIGDRRFKNAVLNVRAGGRAQLPIGVSSSTVAVAMRQKHQRRSDARRLRLKAG